MNLCKTGGVAQTSRASGFLATEACTPRGVATHLGKHWLKRAYRHHEQSRELKLQTLNPTDPILGHQHPVQQAFELAGALGQLAVPGLIGVAAPKELVGDIERRK